MWIGDGLEGVGQAQGRRVIGFAIAVAAELVVARDTEHGLGEESGRDGVDPGGGHGFVGGCSEGRARQAIQHDLAGVLIQLIGAALCVAGKDRVLIGEAMVDAGTAGPRKSQSIVSIGSPPTLH